MAEFEKVFEYVRTIPAGKVTSYGAVGYEVGASAREVGWAMGMVPDDVPWHRVVGADGYLLIAKKGPHMREMQKSLLEAEGVTLNAKGCVERRFFLGEPESPPEQPGMFD